MLTVKVIELGRAVEEFAFDGDVVAVSEVLVASGREDKTGFKVNGVDVAEDYALYDGDTLFVGVKNIKGNNDYVEVKFISVGAQGGIKSAAVEPGTTVAAAAEVAGASLDGFEIKINGSTASSQASTTLNSDSRIFLTKQVKGN